MGDVATVARWVAHGLRGAIPDRGAPSGFSKLAAPFMASAMRRANRKDLEQLKSLLEAR
jgi:hypothetical protein